MGKRNGGFSLIETLVSIVILGAMVVPTCTALVMTVKLNDKTEKMLQAQLAVSSTVETLMAEGISGEIDPERFPDVVITPIPDKSQDNVYYCIQVSDKNMTTDENGNSVSDPLVVVETTIRAADNTPASEPTGGDGE